MKHLAAAGALLALAAAPAAAIPSTDPRPGVPVSDFSSPPMWVSYNGIEKWIPDPGSCIRGACPSVTPGAARRSPVVRVSRGGVVVFHFTKRRVAVAIRAPRTQARRLGSGVGTTFRWRANGPSGVVEITTAKAGWFPFRLIVT